MMFTAYLAKLPNCVNREMIDSAATEFCMQFNTKNNRKKLVKALYSVHRNRQDLLPFYGRFVATLNPCMPDIGEHYVRFSPLTLRNSEQKDGLLIKLFFSSDFDETW